MRISDIKPEGHEFGKWRFSGKLNYVATYKERFVRWLYIGGPAFFHRALLLDILVAKLPKERIHFNKRLVSYEHVSGLEGVQEAIKLHFSDGTSATTDIIVGCDGIKSAVRREMYTSYATEVGASVSEVLERFVEPAWSGSVAYRSLIPANELRKVCPNHSIFNSPQQVGPFANLYITVLSIVLCSITDRTK